MTAILKMFINYYVYISAADYRIWVYFGVVMRILSMRTDP